MLISLRFRPLLRHVSRQNLQLPASTGPAHTLPRTVKPLWPATLATRQSSSVTSNNESHEVSQQAQTPAADQRFEGFKSRDGLEKSVEEAPRKSEHGAIDQSHIRQDGQTTDNAGHHTLERTESAVCSGYGITIASVRPKTMAESMEFFQSPSFGLTRPENPLLVLLVTAKCYDTLPHIEALISRISSNIYSDSDTAYELEVLTVVVDKISVPPTLKLPITIEDFKEGVDGISMFWTSRETLAILDAPPRNSSHVGEQDTGSLTVGLRTRSGIGSLYHQFKIPLANTTFLNGQTCTMFLQKLNIDRGLRETGGHPVLSPILKSELVAQLGTAQVKLNIDNIHALLKKQLWSQRARSELTPRRTVAEVSGNVIKRFEKDGELIPASTELEAAIASIPADQHGHFEVWAEIFNYDAANDRFDERVFVKVVSGGGGWGEKRGLIALDATSSTSREMPAEFDMNNLFPGILKAKDQVSFKLVATSSLHARRPLNRPPGIAMVDQAEIVTRTTFGFGTSGSSEIEEPVDPRLTPSHTLIAGHFGAISTRMILERDRRHPNNKLGRYKTDLPPYTHYSTGGALVYVRPEDSGEGSLADTDEAVVKQYNPLKDGQQHSTNETFEKISRNLQEVSKFRTRKASPRNERSKSTAGSVPKDSRQPVMTGGSSTAPGTVRIRKFQSGPHLVRRVGRKGQS